MCAEVGEVYVLVLRYYVKGQNDTGFHKVAIK